MDCARKCLETLGDNSRFQDAGRSGEVQKLEAGGITVTTPVTCYCGLGLCREDLHKFNLQEGGQLSSIALHHRN